MRPVWKIILLTFFIVILISCVEEPVKEDVPEYITKVTLVFTPMNGGIEVVGSAIDPDGDGVQDIMAEGNIQLSPNTEYSLSILLINELADATSPEYNITDEVEEEGSEHILFFGWTNNLFSSPSGNGNIDNRVDEMNYGDLDNNGNPIGLITHWTTGTSTEAGSFKIILKHQPNLKTETSGVDVGETDLDVMFNLQIQ